LAFQPFHKHHFRFTPGVGSKHAKLNIEHFQYIKIINKTIPRHPDGQYIRDGNHSWKKSLVGRLVGWSVGRLVGWQHKNVQKVQILGLE
jgi:hypothetical protein